MPTTQASESDVTLVALLAARARHASDGRLALNAGGGLIATALALALRPPVWPLVAAAGGCFFAYGAWGITDRALHERAEHARKVRPLRVLRAAAVVVGILCVLAVGGLVMAVALGNWIH
ncbi:MAG TPA: hypothetical protein VFU01_12425 [Gemmatimonadaceae bacterium]|nr:hypothetical protein [Gemmatimonadaceae bacterium]